MLRKYSTLFLVIVLMSVQNAVLAKAESVYDESLTMIVGLDNMNCSVRAILFNVSSSNGPLDTSEFTSEPSFISLIISSSYGMTTVGTEHFTVSFFTEVQILLNKTRLSSEQQGKLIADALKSKFEDLLNTFLFYDKERSQFPSFQFPSDVTHHYYISNVPVVEELGNIFQRQKFPGLSELFSSNPNISNANMQLSLKKIGNSYRWSYQINGFGSGTLFQMSFNQEYTISLNEILSHVGVISSASTASASNIDIEVFTGNANWTFIPLETVPEMSRTQDTSEQITFHADITNSSVDDIRLRFKIIESGNDLTTIYVAAVILGALSCIIGYYFLRRRREHRL